MPELTPQSPPHLPIARTPRWLPWTIAAASILYLALAIGVAIPLLAGNDSPKVRALARWLPIPVARVDGQLIWAREYLDYRTFIETFVARSKEAGQAINPETPIGQQVLNLLVSNTTIERAANASGVNVGAAEVNAAFKDILVLQGGDGQAREVSQEELDTILQELYGSSQEQLRDLIRIRLLQDKVKNELLEQVHFRQILVAEDGQARDLINRLKEGGNFADLAKEQSKHEESREIGGDMGFVVRGEQVEPIETVLFSLPVGVVPDPVKTDFGYHVIEIQEKRGKLQQSYDQWLTDAESNAHAAVYLKISGEPTVQ